MKNPCEGCVPEGHRIPSCPGCCAAPEEYDKWGKVIAEAIAANNKWWIAKGDKLFDCQGKLCPKGNCSDCLENQWQQIKKEAADER